MLARRTPEALVTPSTDTRTVQSLYARMLKFQDQEIRKKQLDLQPRPVELLGRKAKLADLGERTTRASQLNPEERMFRVREIFGLPA